MLGLLSQSWPWYVTGPLLGLMVPLLLMLGNKQFGVSSSLQHMCAAALPLKAGYFQYNWKEQAWNLALVAGVVAGAAIAVLVLDGGRAPAISNSARALFASWGVVSVDALQPAELFSLEHLFSARTLVTLLFGGFLVGFGARYAGGCTSGHAVMGLSLLNFGSLVAVIGFFIGGLLMSHLVVPFVMAL
ncbi:MAG: YeeE/YedE family protein [Spirochaetaceae bacterium]|nr:MAG: YeeE/YedE family protein [Spirochaetaceae bacterium]